MGSDVQLAEMVISNWDEGMFREELLEKNVAKCLGNVPIRGCVCGKFLGRQTIRRKCLGKLLREKSGRVNFHGMSRAWAPTGMGKRGHLLLWKCCSVLCISSYNKTLNRRITFTTCRLLLGYGGTGDPSLDPTGRFSFPDP